MKEKIILSLVAALLGLLVAGGAFYIYQMTRTIEDTGNIDTTITKKLPGPTPQSSYFLIVENPKDEEVTDKRTITVSGKTDPGATIIVATDATDQVIKPANNGDFTLTQTIGEGVTLVHVTAIFQNGEEQTVTKTVTYTAEEF